VPSRSARLSTIGPVVAEGASCLLRLGTRFRQRYRRQRYRSRLHEGPGVGAGLPLARVLLRAVGAGEDAGEGAHAAGVVERGVVGGPGGFEAHDGHGEQLLHDRAREPVEVLAVGGFEAVGVALDLLLADGLEGGAHLLHGRPERLLVEHPRDELRELAFQDLLGARHLALAGGARRGAHGREAVEVDHPVAGPRVDGRLHVARQRDVEHERLVEGERIRAAVRQGSGGDGRLVGPAGDEHEVGPSGGVVPVGPVDDLGPEGLRDGGGALGRAVGDLEAGEAVLREGFEGRLPHLPRPHEQRASPVELTAEVLRGGGDGGARDARAALTEARLGLDALGRAEGRVEEPVHHRAEAPVLVGGAVGVLDLREDLRVPQHQRPEPRRHGQHVLDGRFVVDVERVLAGPGHARVVDERGAQRLHVPVRSVEVGLGAVAGREQHHLGVRRQRQAQAGVEAAPAVGVEREGLAHGDGGGVMGEADGVERHTVRWEASGNYRG
jgi:hypothetical protein